MAKNTYYVVFENNTDGTTVQSPVAEGKKGKTQEEKNRDALLKGVKGYASLNYAESVVNRIVTSKINTVELRDGHAELQQKMQFVYGGIKQGVDTVKSMIVAGSIFGGAGVALATVAGVADYLISVSIRQGEINARKSVEDTSLHFARIRAGAGQDRTGKGSI